VNSGKISASAMPVWWQDDAPRLAIAGSDHDGRDRDPLGIESARNTLVLRLEPRPSGLPLQ